MWGHVVPAKDVLVEDVPAEDVPIEKMMSNRDILSKEIMSTQGRPQRGHLCQFLLLPFRCTDSVTVGPVLTAYIFLK